MLSYAKDHTSALFQQAKEREERLREERASRRDQEAPPNANSQPAKSGMSMVRLVKRKGVGVAESGKKAKLQVVLEDQFKDDEDDEEEGLGGLLGDYDSDDDAEEEEPAKQQQKEDKEEKKDDKPKVKLPAPSELGSWICPTGLMRCISARSRSRRCRRSLCRRRELFATTF